MGFRRTWLLLFILFVFHLQHNFPSVSSRPYSVGTNHETLPFNALNSEVVGFQGKARELVVVMKKGGGGGRGGGGGGRSRGGAGGSSSRSRSRGGIGYIPVHTGGGGSARSQHSGGSSNLRGAVYTVGWLVLSVIAGLLLVQ